MDIYADPMLNVKEAARYLGLSESTLGRWKASGSVHSRKAKRHGWPSLPFVGIVEAFVLQQLRAMGVPLGHIRDTAQSIRERLGDEYGLARPGLGVHGRDIIVDIAGDFYRGSDLQQAAAETISGLQQVISWAGAHPQRLKLSNLGADVILDPRFGWGAPVIGANKVPIESIVGQFEGGDSFADIAYDFDMDAADVEETVRRYLASTRAAAA